jgi:phosphate transport system protein
MADERWEDGMAVGGDAGLSGSEWDAARATLGRHFLRDLEGLWGGVLTLAAVVEDALYRSVRAMRDGRADLADEVRGDERVVDRWEARLERECLKVLALHQPVASDLRRVAAVLKISGDLERMGDLARHIAKRVGKLAADPLAFPVPESLENLAVCALRQVREGLDSLTSCDPDLARAVIAADCEVDALYRVALKGLKRSVRAHPDRVDNWLRLINTARNLERVADHAANIAAAVIYLKEGEIVRHAVPR